jgi:transcription antitermination factor NusG
MEPRNVDYFRLRAEANWLEAKWYVLFVRSNQEKRVTLHLKEKAIEYFLPVYESVRQRSDRKVKLLCPLFPGYVFVHMSFVDRLKALLIPNVIDFVGTKSAPSPVSDEEVEWMMRGTESGKAQPHPYSLNAGSRVRVTAGPMAGLEGCLIRLQNSSRVLIALDSISRAFVVELENHLLELALPREAFQRAS